MLIIWRVMLWLFLALAATNTAVSVYLSLQERWPTTPAAAVTKTESIACKTGGYAKDLVCNFCRIFEREPEVRPPRLGIHDRFILAFAIFALIVRLLMESQLISNRLEAGGPSRWAASRVYAFEVMTTIALAGLLAWLGAAMKMTEHQMPLLWLFVAYLVAHGVWMLFNYELLGGGRTEGVGKFLGLAINSLLFGGVIIAGSFFVREFRDEIKVATAASLVCLVSSVFGFRMVSESFFGGERSGKAVRHLAFIIVCLALIALVALTILAKSYR
jgi:hypothetical protein